MKREKSKSRQLEIWKVVEENFSAHANSLCLAEAGDLREQDIRLVVEVLSIKSLILASFHDKPFEIDWPNFVRAQCKVPISVSEALYEECDRSLFRWKTTDGEGPVLSYDVLKTHLREIHPSAGHLIGPLKEEIMKVINHDLSRARHLRTFFLFSSRLTLRSAADDLEQAAIAAYMENEEHLKTFQYPALDHLREIVTKWYGDIDPFVGFTPTHGNGKVAVIATPKYASTEGALTVEQKYLCCNTPAVLSTLALSKIMRPYEESLVEYREVLGKPRDDSFIAELKTVPKGTSKRRVISYIDPASMFLSQGFSRVIDPSKHHTLGRFCNIKSQVESRDMAQKGSWDLSVATIDLSSASDLISWTMVREMFRNTPWVDAFIRFRPTEIALPDGSLLSLEKFLPAGDATCFTAECIVFLAIIHEVCERAGVDWNVIPVRVYGDDLIIPTSLAPALISRLEELGMRPNKLKSFYGDEPFREACGGEYYAGMDVTPSRISRKFSGLLTRDRRSHSARRVANILNLANQLTPYSFAKNWLLKNLSKLGKSMPLFTDRREDSSKVFSKTCTNFRADSRHWDKVSVIDRTDSRPLARISHIAWQRTEYLGLSIEQKSKYRQKTNGLELHHWLSLASLRPEGLLRPETPELSFLTKDKPSDDEHIASVVRKDIQRTIGQITVQQRWNTP